MNPRLAALAAIAIAAVKEAASFAVRFVRDQPRNEHEKRVFTHLNALVENFISEKLNRTFTPSLRVVK